MSIKVERLVNLTIALLESRRPISFEELRDRTGYYTHGDRESGRRMFERDKDALRSLGVPLAVIQDPLTGEVAYDIDRRDYELPDVDLTREEVAALAMALRLAGHDTDDRLALSKLSARAPDVLGDLPAPSAQVSLGTEVLDDVAEALVTRRTVSFEYRTGRGKIAERTVDPYTIALRNGAWYLIGHDHDRSDVRAFRLDRFAGRATTVSDPGAYEVPESLDVDAHTAGPEAQHVTLELLVTEGARWAVEARGGVRVAPPIEGARDSTIDRARYRIDDVEPSRIVTWILGLGADVEVVQPPDVRDAVVERLRHLVALA